VQRKVVAIRPESRDDEMHPMFHESGNEVHVARQAIEPRDDQRAPDRLCLPQRYRKPRSQQQRIGSGAGLHILVPGPDYEPFAQRESFDLMALRGQP
jgi:hypothetical protein